MVERDLAKVEVAGSRPVFRSGKKATLRRGFFVSAKLFDDAVRAGMVELVDTQDLKSCDRKIVRVRSPLLVRDEASDFQGFLLEEVWEKSGKRVWYKSGTGSWGFPASLIRRVRGAALPMSCRGVTPDF